MNGDLLNDSVLRCQRCDEVIKAYTTSGETNFCPVCGCSELKSIEEE